MVYITEIKRAIKIKIKTEPELEMREKEKVGAEALSKSVGVHNFLKCRCE